MAANLSGMTWWEYVTDVAGRSASQMEIAEAAGVSQATVSRWRSGEIRTPEPFSAARFARHYDRSPLEALVVAGVIEEGDLRTQVTITRHEDPSDDELLDLLRRRLERDRQESEHRGDTTPMTERHPGEVTAPAGPDVDVADELAHRRRAGIADDIAAGRRPAAARTDEQGES